MNQHAFRLGSPAKAPEAVPVRLPMTVGTVNVPVIVSPARRTKLLEGIGMVSPDRMAKVENDRKALIAKQNSLACVRKWAAGPVLVGPTDKQYWEFIKTNTGPVAYITLNPGMPFTNTIASPADLYKNAGAPTVETTITIKMQTERPTPLMLRDGIIWR